VPTFMRESETEGKSRCTPLVGAQELPRDTLTIKHPFGSPPSGLDVLLRRAHAHSILSQQAGMSGFQHSYSNSANQQ